MSGKVPWSLKGQGIGTQILRIVTYSAYGYLRGGMMPIQYYWREKHIKSSAVTTNRFGHYSIRRKERERAGKMLNMINTDIYSIFSEFLLCRKVHIKKEQHPRQAKVGHW
jgi:hypothetical protein